MASNTTLAIRSLLLKGWRERWSDIQWGIHLKEVLPRHSEPKLSIPLGNIETFTFLYRLIILRQSLFCTIFIEKLDRFFLYSSTVIFRSDFLEKW